MYTTKNSINNNRAQKILPKPTTPQNSREIESVVFIPYTQNASLRKELQKVDDQTTKVLGMGRTKYEERAGVQLSQALMDKNPWVKLNQGCGRDFSCPCKSSKGKGISCRAEGVCYSITCIPCEKEKLKAIYIGETSRSACERMYEHMYNFKRKI